MGNSEKGNRVYRMIDAEELARHEHYRRQVEDRERRTDAIVDIADALQRIAAALEGPGSKKHKSVARKVLKMVGSA